MRRTDGGTDPVDRTGPRTRPVAALFLLLGLAAIAPPTATRGDEPARVDRVGQRVVARFGGLALRDDRDAVAGVGDRDRIYRVEQIDGRRVWLRAEGKDLAGWAPADEVEVVAVAPAEDSAVRRADIRPPRGFGSVLGTSLRHADSQAHLRHAEAAAGRGDYDRAIARCTEAIRLDPRSAEVYYVRGTTWAAMNRMDQALIDLDEAIRLRPRNPAALVARGEVRLALKDDARAIADLDEAIRFGYRDAIAYYDRGRARHNLGQLDAALADLDEAIRRDSGLAMAYADRAMVRGLKGETDRAIADLNEAIRLDPRSARYHFDRSRFLRMKRQTDGAIADLNEAIRIDPRCAWAYGERAWIWATYPAAMLRDGKRAVESATRACELTGWKDARSLGILAAACAEAGDFDAAVKWQTQANEGYSDDDHRSGGEGLLELYQTRTPYRTTEP